VILVLGAIGSIDIALAQQTHDFLIVPGVRVGPVTKKSTESDLKRVFGAANVLHEALMVRDADPYPGLVIYSRPHYHPSNRLLEVIPDGQGRAHSVSISSQRWRTSSGIRLGMTASELEQINGKPFRLYGFGWDFQGGVMSWEGGKLEGVKFSISFYLYPSQKPTGDWRSILSPEEYESVEGPKEILSDHPVMRKLRLTVVDIQVRLNTRD